MYKSRLCKYTKFNYLFDFDLGKKGIIGMHLPANEDGIRNVAEQCSNLTTEMNSSIFYWKKEKTLMHVSKEKTHYFFNRQKQ